MNARVLRRTGQWKVDLSKTEQSILQQADNILAQLAVFPIEYKASVLAAHAALVDVIQATAKDKKDLKPAPILDAIENGGGA